MLITGHTSMPQGLYDAIVMDSFERMMDGFRRVSTFDYEGTDWDIAMQVAAVGPPHTLYAMASLHGIALAARVLTNHRHLTADLQRNG